MSIDGFENIPFNSQMSEDGKRPMSGYHEAHYEDEFIRPSLRNVLRRGGRSPRDDHSRNGDLRKTKRNRTVAPQTMTGGRAKFPEPIEMTRDEMQLVRD